MEKEKNKSESKKSRVLSSLNEIQKKDYDTKFNQPDFKGSLSLNLNNSRNILITGRTYPEHLPNVSEGNIWPESKDYSQDELKEKFKQSMKLFEYEYTEGIRISFLNADYSGDAIDDLKLSKECKVNDVVILEANKDAKLNKHFPGTVYCTNTPTFELHLSENTLTNFINILNSNIYNKINFFVQFSYFMADDFQYRIMKYDIKFIL